MKSDLGNKIKTKLGGLSLKRMSFVMGALFLIIVVLLMVSTVLTLSQFNRTKDDAQNYIVWQQSTGLLQSGSDELTYDVRAFTVTGNKQYVDAYFKEVKETRRREKALETIQSAVYNKEVEMHLNNAMQTSIVLMGKEYYSMRLVIEALNYDVKDFPIELQEVDIYPEDLALSRDEKLALAGTMVVDDSYQWYKNLIEDELRQCLSILATATEDTISRSFDTLSSMFVLQVILIALIIVVVTLVILITTAQVINPLIKAVPRIMSEEPLSTKGAKEYVILAKAYNKMFVAHNEQKQLLEHEATHDAMTGLINRAGFYAVCAAADMEKTALIIIDVDDFKHINDTYGHDAGDNSLVVISKALTDAFAPEDSICRIGGDEFVVVMKNAKENDLSRTIIRDRIASVNKAISLPQDNGAVLSISCGAAFGRQGDTLETLMKRADNALYFVKDNGKQNVEFA